MNPALIASLERVENRRRQLRFWLRLAACWAGAGAAALVLTLVQRQTGFGSSLVPILLLVAAAGAGVVFARSGRRAQPDWRELARMIESRQPGLEGRLLTAVQQHPEPGRAFSYLQMRLLNEVLADAVRGDWAAAVPRRRIAWAHAAHWVALAVFVAALIGYPDGHRLSLLTRGFASDVTVTPGDATLERGHPLVVLASFNGTVPAAAELVLEPPGSAQRIPLTRSLADPLFGATVPEVTTNLVYHVEYGSRRTRDFHVTVFEYPSLERADAGLTFPEYTGLPPKRIENTRRISAVEGSRLDLTLRFNKPVVSARLVPADARQTPLPIALETNRAAASLHGVTLAIGGTYELQLADPEGRTNKTRPQFVIEVLTNRAPELRLTLPRGDQRPSALEEIAFEGAVSDDFGVRAYGIGYSFAGNARFIELGGTVPARDQRTFEHFLRLEELAARPGQLISWFVWADDTGPDGGLRRNLGDLFFAEVRPFDETFREGESMPMNAAGESSPVERIAELQRQIISATWNVQRGQGTNAVPSPPASRPSTRTGSGHPFFAAALRTAPARSAAVDGRVPSGGSSLPVLLAQATSPSRGATPRRERAGTGAADDLTVLAEAQAEVIELAKSARQMQANSANPQSWDDVLHKMELALEKLRQARNAPALLGEALAAEQAAYEALLKLVEHEYRVSRSAGGGQSGAQRQLQQQLEQMDLTASENRYETQRQAQPPPPAQRSEQLRTLNRLQELARRQQDLNNSLQELQTALQQARTEQERAEIQRQLKRLRDQEQQILADLDELRQRLARPENFARSAEELRQLDQSREDVRRAADAVAEGAASRALAAGTRAERRLEQLREQIRRENSSQFAEDLQQMRRQARELSRQQDDLLAQMNDQSANAPRLSDSPELRQLQEQSTRQLALLTNLVEHATRVSQQAEAAEPLLSRHLYDAIRKFAQDSARDVHQLQDQWIQHGFMTRKLYEQLQSPAESDGAKLLGAISEMLRLGYPAEAAGAARNARNRIEDLKNGIERAAESVLGDDTQALQLAQQELDRLTDELGREISAAQSGRAATNAPASATRNAGPPDTNSVAAAAGTQALFDIAAEPVAGPIAGDNFLTWSGRLRDVQDMLEDPVLRNEVAAARERARAMRQESRRAGRTPDWAVVRLQIEQPLVEVRNRIAEELARRGSKEALVPIDRDPIPGRYADQVRRYYEELSKEK